MIKTIILTLIIGILLFELIEHVVFPLLWSIRGRKRKSVCGVSGMLGKIGEVKEWKKNEGKVFVSGELWKAVSDVPLMRGDRVVIQNVKGLTLEVSHWKGEDEAVLDQLSPYKILRIEDAGYVATPHQEVFHMIPAMDPM